MISEIHKSKSSIVGIDYLILGVLFISGWLALFYFFKHWLVNIVSFSLLFLGLFSFFAGIQQIAYSVVWFIKQKKDGNSTDFNRDDFLLFLTKLFGALLVFAQVCKAVLEIKNN